MNTFITNGTVRYKIMNNKKTKLALLIAGILTASSANSQNLFENPRFEDDDTAATGWTVGNGNVFTVGHDESDDNNTALNGNHNGTEFKSNFIYFPSTVTSNLFQEVANLEQGVRYRASLLVRLDADVDATSDMFFIVKDQTANTLIVNQTINVTNQDGWVVKSVDFIVPEGSDLTRFIVYKAGNASAVSIDNFDLRRVDDENLVADAAFESGTLDAWDISDTGVTIVDNTVVGDENNTYRGQYAAKLVEASGWGSHLRHHVFLKPDTAYELAFYAKKDASGGNAIVNIKTDLDNGGAGSQGFAPNITIDSEDWQLYTTRFTTTTDATDCVESGDRQTLPTLCTADARALESFVWLGAGGAGTFYIDNVQLRDISNSNPNLITDPSFEAADPLSTFPTSQGSGTIVTADADNAYEGDSYFSIPDGQGSVQQYIDLLEPNTTYQVSFYAKGDAVWSVHLNGANAFIGQEGANGGGAVSFTTDEYTLQTREFTTPDEPILYTRFWVWTNRDVATSIDNVEIKKLPAVPNLLANASFVNGDLQASWAGSDNESLMNFPNADSDSERPIVATTTGALNQRVDLIVPEGGDISDVTYIVSATARVSAGSYSWGINRDRPKSATNGDNFTATDAFETISFEWTPSEEDLALDPALTTIAVWFWNDQDTESIYVKDVSLVEKNLEAVPIESITIEGAPTSSVEAGEVINLTAMVLPEEATDPTVTWTSSDTGVATVSDMGEVKTLTGGTVTITASNTDESVQSAVDITVVVLTSGIAVESEDLELIPGATATISATVMPATASNKDFAWMSTNEDIATVDANGMVTAISLGQAEIMATTDEGGHKDTIFVSVAADPVGGVVTSVDINQASVSVLAGDARTLSVTVTESTAPDTSVSWMSSDTSVATVDENGRVMGVSEGTATITATTNDLSATLPGSEELISDTAMVTVTEPPKTKSSSGSFGASILAMLSLAFIRRRKS